MDAPINALLAYATQPGNLAGDDANTSLFARTLAQELKVPKSRIEDLFKRTRVQVRTLSGGRQIPWESNSLESDVKLPVPGASQ